MAFTQRLYQLSLPLHFFLGKEICSLSILVDSPPPAARRGSCFGDTPNPGKGLRPLHSYLSVDEELAYFIHTISGLFM